VGIGHEFADGVLGQGEADVLFPGDCRYASNTAMAEVIGAAALSSAFSDSSASGSPDKIATIADASTNIRYRR
jgi:hypothetical protein